MTGQAVLVEEVADLFFDRLDVKLFIVDHVALVQGRRGSSERQPDGRAALTSLGRRPSVAATTRIAPSIWAAPVIMFFTKSAWPGRS